MTTAPVDGLREAVYAEPAAAGPVTPITMPNGLPVWLVTGHAEARAALTDPRLVRTGAPRLGPFSDLLPPGVAAAKDSHLLDLDPPDHTRLRTLVSAAFTRRRIDALGPRIQQITDELLDAFDPTVETDLIEAFAAPLPITVICELLGVPDAGRTDFGDWSTTIVAGRLAGPESFVAASVAMIGYIRELVAAKRRDPADDLLSALIVVRDDTEGSLAGPSIGPDRLTEDELTSMVFLLLVAGHETTVNLIGNGVLALLTHPDQLVLLRAEPERLGAAVEELLRFDGPLQVATSRRAAEPVELGGVVIPADAIVLPALLAANRDPARFPNVDRLDITRPDPGHLAFGHGRHLCLGAALARLEGRIAIGSLLARFPHLRLARRVDQLTRRPSVLIHGLAALPVLIGPDMTSRAVERARSRSIARTARPPAADPMDVPLYRTAPTAGRFPIPAATGVAVRPEDRQYRGYEYRGEEMTTTHTAVFTSHWPDVEIPNSTLPEFLLGAAADRAGEPALVDGPSGRVTTYGELAAGVRRVAAGLAARGLRKGDVFAILAPNLPEWLLAAYGAMTVGGIVTGINPLYTPDEVAGQLADSEARFLLTVPPFLPTAQAAVARTGRDTEIVLLGPPTEATTPFAELLVHGDDPPAVAIDPAVDLALLPYSSGTSGLPKGVMLTHRACVANVLQQRAAFSFAPGERTLAVAPFFHATGFGVVANGAIQGGAAVVTMPRFDVESFLGLIQEHRITSMVVVPPIVLALAKHPAVDRYDLSSLQWIGCGAAPLGAELQQACTHRLGRPVLQGYGMTEVTAAAAIWGLDIPVRPGAAGQLLPGVQARIVDLATGADLGPGEAGELWLRGPSTMAGYLRNPEATAATIDPQGWLRTGDVARIDDDGALFVVDRIKELIKVKGFQVAPAELEAVLRTHPGVAEAAVVGVPDERAGELPKAFVVRTAGGDALTADEVMAYVAERVAPHKRVRTVEFIDAIPTSPAGKTLRRLLRAR